MTTIDMEAEALPKYRISIKVNKDYVRWVQVDKWVDAKPDWTMPMDPALATIFETHAEAQRFTDFGTEWAGQLDFVFRVERMP